VHTKRHIEWATEWQKPCHSRALDDPHVKHTVQCTFGEKPAKNWNGVFVRWYVVPEDENMSCNVKPTTIHTEEQSMMRLADGWMHWHFGSVPVHPFHHSNYRRRQVLFHSLAYLPDFFKSSYQNLSPRLHRNNCFQRIRRRCDPDSSVSMVSPWLRTGRPGSDPRERQRIFPLTSASRPALGSTQPPVQWVPGVLSLGVKRGRSVMLNTHPLLVPSLRKSRSYTSSHSKRLQGV
jgi:hypothetical protein